MMKVSCRCKEYLCIKRLKNLKNIMYFKWIYEMFKKDWCDGNMAGLKRTTFFVNQKQSQLTMKVLSKPISTFFIS